ncbi:MAG: hypothetical protein JG782_1502 [Anaerophaga sp.]|uniref:DUF4834 family protein n=1 Tax=Anaerophaga thermohalophila TaxID=177400 RepID=UPI0011122B57|nr:DUF4834 family protein [Anaerophaga thermohalophila]MBZ4676882.1 hypothetical protein [Anaerophaga sp.]
MLFRVIIYTILIYYVFKLVFRYLMPLFISKQARKMQKRQENAHEEYINRKKKEEGKVTVEYDPEKQKRNDKDSHGGEYVDYEEIK